MSDKGQFVAALSRAVTETAAWHTPDGWYCTRCDVSCGAEPLAAHDMCPCCRALFNAYDIAVGAAAGDEQP